MYDRDSMVIPLRSKHERSPAARPRGSRARAEIQAVIDAVDSLVVIVGPEGTLWTWNRRCEETSGVPLTDVAGKPLWSVMRLRRSLQAQAQAAFDALVNGEVAQVEFQAQWLRKDGRKARTRWVARLVGKDGSPEYIVATGTESTRGSRVAQVLDETEGRFEKLLAVLPDPVVVHQNGRIVFANTAAVELYGARDRDSIIGQPVIERVAPESRPAVIERMKMMLGERRDAPLLEERHVRMDGKAFDVEVVAAPVTFNGKPAIELVARDVSTRNEMLAALRDSEARVRAVFDQSALGMALISTDARVVESNAAFQRLLGYPNDELASMEIAEFTHPDDRERTAAAVADLFSGRVDFVDMEKRYVAADGHEIWARTHVAPIRDREGRTRLAVATVEDVGEHKALEEHLRQASKMEALGRLAAGVAHDFNNLLTVVSGYSDLLAKELEGEQREDVLKIQEAGGKAKELTTQLLAFGRRVKPALKPIDLNHHIQEIAPMLRRLVGEDIEIELQFDDAIKTVEADPGQLDQVIINLVVNARDAMPGGGKLGLSTRFLDYIPGREPGGVWARIEISDTGFGMESQVIEHIFEPFFTTKGHEGTGLGLSIVYGIVRQMAGLVSVESRVGYGSRFIVDLPHRGTRVDDGGRDETIGRASTAPATILVVEDEASVRDLCRRALEAEGYTVSACGPHEALEIADELGRRLDLVLTDVVMPDLDGPTIAAALRSRRQDLPILFMTGYPRNREEELTGAVARGEVLSKPFTAQELCDAVRRLLGH
jgi:two-component system cell cycle sensor histidine kinase/response regulator CckA